MLRSRLLLTVAAVTVALSACGDGAVEEVLDDVADGADAVAEDLDDAVEDATEDEEHEGETPDPAALFGAEVCDALLPAVYGDTDGLDRYATPEVLDELSSGAGDAAFSQDVIVHGGGEECFISIGDLTWTLELMGDGHVGQNAVAISSSLGIDSGDGADADPALIAEAVAAHRELDACDGFAEELPEGMADHEVFALGDLTVVGVVCATFAYQSIYELSGWDGALYALEVEQWLDGVVISSQVLGFPYVEDGLLTNLEKGRGIGDCGTFQTWTPGDGDVLLLVEARVRDCDDESEYVEPTEWELVYVADV